MDTGTQSIQNNPMKQKGWISGRRVLAIILFLCGAGGTLVFFLAQQRSFGETRVLVPVDTALEKEEVVGTKLYQGKYIQFSLPESFVIQTDRPLPKPPILEQQLWQQAGFEGKKVALTVQDISGYQLEEYGSFRLRKAQSSVYSEERYEKNGISWTIFRTTAPVFEAGAFVKRENQALSIVLSSPTQHSGLTEELSTILDSVLFP